MIYQVYGLKDINFFGINLNSVQYQSKFQQIFCVEMDEISKNSNKNTNINKK